MNFIVASVILILAAGIAVVASGRRPQLGDRLYQILILVGCAIGLVPAVSVLVGGHPAELRVASAVPGGPWIFGLDPLSGAFLIVVLAVGATCAVYGVPYLAHDRAAHRPVSGAHGLVALLLASMVAVVTARAALPFLVAWEVMAVSAYFLVVFESEQPAVRRAGLLYLVVTHAGLLALLGLFALWGNGARDLTFDALAHHAPALGGSVVMILALALLGFGVKAGIVPFHFWLPEAHAAAPSHVSALMSGVVIKMGIYGLLRVVLLLGAPPAWWGWVVLGLGMSSGVLGVVWALAQHDLKRLLAFHSVENIGIILLGMGVGSLGLTYGRPVIAVLGFAGAILHTLNHAVFKSLLFLGAGSVSRAAGTRDIDRLGGLATALPRTAAAFMIGSAAIVGLPPLNGFVSEWLVFRALLETGTARTNLHFAILAAAALALIGGLALACFAKVVGAVFLGKPRDPAIQPIPETAGLTGPLTVLAAACFAIGVLPVLILPSAFRAGGQLAGQVGLLVGDPASTALTWGALALACSVLVLALGRAALVRRQPSHQADTWGCGYQPVTARMQYTAASFAAPLLVVFHAVAGVRTERTAGAFVTHPVDPILERMIIPGWHGIRTAAARLRSLYRGHLSLYLLYIIATLVVLLVYLVNYR